MKSLQQLLLTINNKLKRYNADGIFCYLDTERNDETLLQVSAIVAKESKTDLEIIDTFNLYLTPEGRKQHQLDILRFFCKYPNMLYVGNSVKNDVNLLCKYLINSPNSEHISNGLMKKSSIELVKSYVEELGNTTHCKSITVKESLNCWLNENNGAVYCPYESECRHLVIQRMLQGCQSSCINTGKYRNMNLYVKHLGLQTKVKDLESIKSELGITQIHVNELIKKEFKGITSTLRMHDAIFDVTLMYILQRYLKLVTVSRDVFTESRVKDIARNTQVSLKDTENFNYIGIIDTSIKNQKTDSVSIIILKETKYHTRVVDMLDIVGMNKYTTDELTTKITEFTRKYPKTFYWGYNLPNKIALLTYKLLGLPLNVDSSIHVEEEDSEILKSWMRTYRQKRGDSIYKILLGGGYAYYNMTSVLWKHVYKNGNATDFNLLDTNLVLNDLGIANQDIFKMPALRDDSTLNNCCRLLEIYMECKHGKSDLKLSIDSNGVLSWEELDARYRIS